MANSKSEIPKGGYILEDKPKQRKGGYIREDEQPEYGEKTLGGAKINPSPLPYDKVDSSGFPTFLRSLSRSALQAGLNASDIIPALRNAKHITNLLTGKQTDIRIPDFIQEKQEDMGHPQASTLGDIAGYAIPATGEVKAMELIPAVSRFAEKAGSSLLKRILLNSGEGAVVGTSLAPEGQRTKEGLMGGTLGPALGEVIHGVKNLPQLWNKIKTIANAGEAEKGLQEATQGHFNAEEDLKNYHQNAQNEEQNSEQAVKEHLGEGQQHNVRLATELNEKYAKVENEGKKIFSDLEGSLKQKNVELPSQDTSIPELRKKLNEALVAAKGNFSNPAVKQASQNIDSFLKGNKKTVNMNDMFNQYRNMRDITGEMWSDTTNPLLNTEERHILRAKAEDMQKQTDEIKKLFESHLDDKDKELLEKGNEIYRESIYPVRGSKVFRSASKEGVVPENVIDKLSGPEISTIENKDLTNQMKGKKVLRNWIQSNPEASRLALGQKYASNPKAIHAPNDAVQPYLEGHPITKSLIENHKEAIENTKSAESAIKLSKESERYLNQGQEIPQNYDTAFKHVEDLTKLVNQKNISLKEKIRLQKELDNAKKYASQLKNAALYSGGTAVAGSSLYGALHRLLGGSE